MADFDKKIFGVQKYLKCWCLQVNSQLLEAVQQKVVLSQRLEHMEEDMDTFIQKQLSTRLAMRESDTSSEGEMEKETLARRISKTIFRH